MSSADDDVIAGLVIGDHRRMLPACGRRDTMPHLGLRYEIDTVAKIPRSQGPVDILVEKEESGIEQADPFECSPRQKDGGSDRALRLGRFAKLAYVEFAIADHSSAVG